MKYLVPCPACGRKSAVATGQAGQFLQCTCGEKFEVPPIRKLRELEPAEEEPLAPLWTMRKGFLFIGGLVTLCSVAFAAVIWIYRPAQFIPPTIEFDRNAVDQEVQVLSPAEAFQRIALIQPEMRSAASFEERVHTKSVPPYLMVSAQPLLDFEGRGPGPMAPKQMAVIARETSKYIAQITANRSVRQNLVQWLMLAGIAAVVGIVITCLAFFVRPSDARNRRQRAPQRA